MRKLLLASTAACGTVLGATWAHADVFVQATVEKDKDVFITEFIEVQKTIEIDASIDIDTDKAAESLAIVNQSTHTNEACTNCAEKSDLIDVSLNDNSGIVTWNQSSGNMNNQGNAIATSVDLIVSPPDDAPPSEDFGFADAQASGTQITGDTGTPAPQLQDDTDPVNAPTDGVQRGSNVVDTINLVFRDVIMQGSGNSNSGILFANQTNGNMNNQANALAVAVSFSEDGVALAESDLGQWNTGNTVQESDNFSGSGDVQLQDGVGINKTASITGSLNSNTGIVGVNQTSGNMANQGNFYSVAFVQVGSGS